jgi:hypothetical protein
MFPAPITVTCIVRDLLLLSHWLRVGRLVFRQPLPK